MRRPSALLRGTVASIGAGVATVTIDGVTIAAILLDGYTPAVGDVVTVLQEGRRVVVLQTLTGDPCLPSPLSGTYPALPTDSVILMEGLWTTGYVGWSTVVYLTPAGGTELAQSTASVIANAISNTPRTFGAQWAWFRVTSPLAEGWTVRFSAAPDLFKVRAIRNLASAGLSDYAAVGVQNLQSGTQSWTATGTGCVFGVSALWKDSSLSWGLGTVSSATATDPINGKITVATYARKDYAGGLHPWAGVPYFTNPGRSGEFAIGRLPR